MVARSEQFAMKPAQILFMTGTDTNVGKTVFAALATVYLRQNGFRVAALKPLCSGGGRMRGFCTRRRERFFR